MNPLMAFKRKEGKEKKSKLTNIINYSKPAARWNGITVCFTIQGSVKVPGKEKGKIAVGLWGELPLFCSKAESHIIQFHILPLKCYWIFLELTNAETPRGGTAWTSQKLKPPICIYGAGITQVSPWAKFVIKTVLSRAGFAIEGLYCAAELHTELLVSAWRSSGIIFLSVCPPMADRAHMDTMRFKSSAAMVLLFAHQ